MEINPNTKKKEQVYVIDEETGKKYLPMLN